jgi:hypothetical protein
LLESQIDARPSFLKVVSAVKIMNQRSYEPAAIPFPRPVLALFLLCAFVAMALPTVNCRFPSVMPLTAFGRAYLESVKVETPPPGVKPVYTYHRYNMYGEKAYDRALETRPESCLFTAGLCFFVTVMIHEIDPTAFDRVPGLQSYGTFTVLPASAAQATT